MEIWILIGKTILCYLFLIIVIRIMGKREIGNLSVFDLAVYFTISDLITMSIVDKKNPVYLPVISVAVLVLMQILFAYISLRNKKFRDLLDGKRSIIIHNGYIDFNEMKKQRYTIDDLFSQLGEKGFDSPIHIKWAILETNGKLSVISHDNSQSDYPEPIICDGIINYEILDKINKNEKWVYNQIQSKKINDLKKIRLAIFNQDQLTFFIK